MQEQWMEVKTKGKFKQWYEGEVEKWNEKKSNLQDQMVKYMGKYMFRILIMGFLLGRASILGDLTPFALSYYAVVLKLRKKHSWLLLMAIGAGAITAHSAFAVWPMLFATMFLYQILYTLLNRQKILELNVIPVVVFLVDAGVRIGYSSGFGDLSQYALIMSVVDGFLAMVLSYIFIQLLPILTFQRSVRQLRIEEIICLVILLASVLTGFQGLSFYQLSIENIFSRYLIMLFALIGGAGIGAGVGVVVGIILTMGNLGATTQIGLLAFSGVLAGLLRDTRKWGVGLGFTMGTAILTVYVANLHDVWMGVSETALAFAGILFTPKSFIEKVSRYVPGTHQFRLSQQDYARRVRDVMANRIGEVSNVFAELSRTFLQTSSTMLQPQDEQMNKTIQRAAQRGCTGCSKQNQCWDKEFYQTYRTMFDVITIMEEKGENVLRDSPSILRDKCIKTEQFIQHLYESMEESKRELLWQTHIQDSRNLVASQLAGVSRIMGDLAVEMQKENHISADHEEHIIAALEQLGMTVQSVDIICLDEGKVEIEVTQVGCEDARSQCEKMVAPLLSEIIGETITVSDRDTEFHDGFATFRLTSARAFQIVTGVASAAKDGRVLSGDSFTSLDVGNGKFAVAVSDGMGNGERAMQESSAAIRLLQQLLKAGFDEQLAIKTVNSTLLLRSPDEMFTTMDLALIDLFTAHTELLKIGSAPSFIKRGRKVRMVQGENIPIGILQEIDIQTVEEQLEQGDILILLSDGIYEAPKHVVDKEDWLRRRIEQLESDDPQEIADMLVELAARINQGKITDDMTVVAARVDVFKPEWSTIRLPGVGRIKRNSGGVPYSNRSFEEPVKA
ncbi:stage II sporulation protein E [Fodinisporobacter ferrooxydans]|uniref:Stage II sporulation protein E n=1 Tax=Fodinisporobacter ferrooxydans TaxID=2901836 RepID=A0ABY4CVC1_9BACL|nr:stage II sporulation protein E [Alicyclobacillaceae bacterium MYW30-H2]